MNKEKLYVRDGKAYTCKQIQKITGLTQFAARHRLEQWIKRRMTTKQLLSTKSLKSGPKPGQKEVIPGAEEMLQRIPAPSKLERELFG